MSEPSTTLAPLLRSRPSAVGVPAAAVHGVLDDLDRRGLELHSLMIVRHGHVAAEGWWAPYSPERVHLLYSLSKSFTSSAVAFAVAEGRFRLDDRVVDLLPGYVPDEIDPAVAQLSVHHLLSMSTGHRDDTLERAWRRGRGDVVAGFLQIPPEEPVGSRHAYNNATTKTLATIVEKHSGLFLLDYLRPRLLDPLGIRAAHWDADPDGGAQGFSGLHLQTESIATFGQLLLQDGVWNGLRVLPEDWVSLATRKHIDNDNDPAGNIDWRQGYGYQYWKSRHGFRGDGAFGQFCVVVPDADLVVATTACTEDMQGVLDIIWEHLLPSLDSTSSDGEAQEAQEAQLTDRLAALALPVVEPNHNGPGGDVRFVVDGDDPDQPLPSGTGVTVAPDGAGQLLTITLPGTDVALPCGRDHWAESEVNGVPVVCRGGWTGADSFEADLVLIETPHRIRLWGNGSRLEARWNVPPLAGPGLEQHLGR